MRIVIPIIVDGTPGARRFLRFDLGQAWYPGHVGWPRYAVPGLLGRVLRGERDHELRYLSLLLSAGRGR